uniref:hypothetical protein n=1 Tax=Algoriphagus sp. TaxID=1872435 RepID=UPI0025F65F42
FILLFVGVFSSCKEKEEPVNGEVNVIISGIELLEPSKFPSSRISADNTWEHEYEPKLSLTFLASSGEKFNLDINPNNFTSPFSISLPKGNYELTGSSSITDSFSLLPLRIKQNLTVNTSDQKIQLTATSDAGLFTITNKNLGNSAPQLFISNQKLKLKGKFYYFYSNSGAGQKVKIPLSDGSSSFNFDWEPKPFTHRHLGLDNPNDPSDIESFIQDDFLLDQNQLLISEKGIPTNLSPKIQSELPISQNENSGLAFIQNRLFSINDGGNTNDIFELNPNTGAVIRTIRVSNATNSDWEDLAQSDTHLFIGDFGNNNGTRKDLAIYKISIASLLTLDEVTGEKINFTYSDQTDFSGNGGKHNFDCEAFFFASNQLHLFTKNRVDQKTNHYTLNPNQTSGTAILTSGFDIKGLVTAASIDQLGNICLLGYEDAGLASRSFIWLFSKYSGIAFFSGKSNRIFLGSPSLLSQTEGLIFDQEGQVIITGEQISLSGFTVPAKLSKIDLRGLF